MASPTDKSCLVQLLNLVCIGFRIVGLLLGINIVCDEDQTEGSSSALREQTYDAILDSSVLVTCRRTFRISIDKILRPTLYVKLKVYGPGLLDFVLRALRPLGRVTHVSVFR